MRYLICVALGVSIGVALSLYLADSHVVAQAIIHEWVSHHTAQIVDFAGELMWIICMPPALYIGAEILREIRAVKNRLDRLPGGRWEGNGGPRDS